MAAPNEQNQDQMWEMFGRCQTSFLRRVWLGMIAAAATACSSGGGNGSAPASTITSLALSASSVIVGNAVSLTATVTATGTPVTTGTVTFYDGDTVLGAQVLNNSGQGVWSSPSFVVGSHNLTAKYAGNSSYAASSSSAAALTVKGLQSGIALSASATSVAQGIPVQLAATVTSATAGAQIPTGTVTFAIGSVALGTVFVDPTGVASLTSTTLSPGGSSLIATYNGDSMYAAAQSPAVTVAINEPARTTYNNPLTLNVSASQKAVSCADPAIYKLQSNGANRWYLYCTSDALYAGDPNPHFINIFHSSDLVNWTYDGNAFRGCHRGPT